MTSPSEPRLVIFCKFLLCCFPRQKTPTFETQTGYVMSSDKSARRVCSTLVNLFV